VNAAKGKSGYFPACSNEWRSGLCNKPQTKCSECPNQAFLKLDACAVRAHLEGKITIGTYAIREDDTCIFLAADFDKMSWSEDVIAYKNAARELGIEVAIERSKSGDGAHAWIFFSQPLPARLARQLGTVIMSRASSSRYTLSLDSHDRFFPSQDFLPKGGFGNLIALPLQKVPREQGNTAFVNDAMISYQDQWEFLARQRRLSLDDIMSVLDEAISKDVSDLSFPFRNSDVQIAEKTIDFVVKEMKSDFFPHNIQMRLSAQLEDACLKLSGDAGAEVNLVDNRIVLQKVKMKFRGKLSREQERAVSKLAKHENGVLVAPPVAVIIYPRD